MTQSFGICKPVCKAQDPPDIIISVCRVGAFLADWGLTASWKP